MCDSTRYFKGFQILFSCLLASYPYVPQNNTPASATFVPDGLTIQFVPSQNAETLEAKAKPLEKLLGDRLGIPVKMTVSNSYPNVIQAMATKKVDISFLPPSQYVYAHDNLKVADVLMQALRYGADPLTGKPTQKLVDFYQSMIVVKADSPIWNFEDLRGKTIGWQGVTSAAGYVYPGLVLRNSGINPVKDVEGKMYQGHDRAIVGLLKGQVDAAAVFQDVRSLMLRDFPDVLKDTRILAFSDKIPNDTIAIRSDMDSEWRKKIQDAFVSLGNDPVGKKTIQDVFAHQGYTLSEDNKFEIVREALSSISED
ncbi:phosphate/phosphite/phosphonate ABC transporter substrate-binding protein [Bacillus sp. 3255]|uniref:phosphate/phosphite/phosphonate ABC transporter substrate-binding protein n=1 Tax=Bacillus sp. 3255 TaxID=2817904 RepID=UPI00286D16B4|nr:phosphate/phosphite/phosphonate ABC transporter substrate-binding protein [Bacillus sp. 3255]